MEQSAPKTGAVALVALCHEYCSAVESCAETEPTDFCRSMLRLLPRIYITAFDLLPDGENEEGESTGAQYAALEEDEYFAIKDKLAALFGEHDTYLDTFSEDMKYSETPIASSIAEQLADLYQTAYDFVYTVRESASDFLPEILSDVKFRFNAYWSETLCNAQRAINSLYQKEVFTEE